MSYRRFLPHPALAHLVEYFGIQQSEDQTDAVTEVLPTTHHDLLIHFADPFLHHQDDQLEREPTAYICGQRTQPYKVSAAGKTGIVICSFYPWAISELTGTSLGCSSNQTVDAIDVFPKIRCVLDRVLSGSDARARIRPLESYLLSQLKHANCFARQSAGFILNNPHASMNQIAKHFGVSKRHLDRQFINAVGLSPKMFSRILKFQTALSYRQTATSAASIAAACGYYDQAHMHRELKRLGGHTPGQLFDKTDSTPLLSQFNLRPPHMSRFYNTLYLV